MLDAPRSWCSELPALSHVGTEQEQERGKTNQHAHPGEAPACAREGLAGFERLRLRKRRCLLCPFICRGKAGPTARATLTVRPVWFGGKPVVRDGWKVPTLEDTRGPACLFTVLAVAHFFRRSLSLGAYAPRRRTRLRPPSK